VTPARPNLNTCGAVTRDGVSNDPRTFVMPVNGSGRLPTINTTTCIPLTNSSAVFGNLGRNTFRGPKFAKWNVGLCKNVQFGERWKLQLRNDMIHALNQYNFGNPIATMNSPIFGTNTSNPGNRTMLMSVKVLF